MHGAVHVCWAAAAAGRECMCGKRGGEKKGRIYGLTQNDPTGKDYVLLNRVVHQGKASHLIYSILVIR